MITHHTQLLNALIEKYGLKSYLEIGIFNRSNNFDKIECQLKHGIDPDVAWANDISNETSDSFFERYYSKVNNRTIFDICFIDGLHTAEQVKKDFDNCLKQLPDTGFIVIHDVLPENEEGTRVPRETKQWWGDVYKWAMRVRNQKGVNVKTFNIDNGCMLVWKDLSNSQKFPFIKDNDYTDWEWYQAHHRTLMNVTDEVII